MGALHQVLLVLGGGTTPPTDSDFDHWVDGEPQVSIPGGENFAYWADGEPSVEGGF